MLERALELFPDASPLVDQASRQVKRDLRQASREFASNRDIQLAGFVTNHIYLSFLTSSGWQAELSLGASLGELNHIVHIGALTFERALDLVAKRGEAYDLGPPGERAVLYPLQLSRAQSMLQGTSLEVAGHLAPGVVLVGGDRESLRAFVNARPELTSRFLGVKLPIHSSHFRSVGESLRPALKEAGLGKPGRPYLPNATGRLLLNPAPEEIEELLARQVWQPMWWRESLDEALQSQPGATLVEVGPGRTLAKLLQAAPTWHPGLQVLSAEDLAERGS